MSHPTPAPAPEPGEQLAANLDLRSLDDPALFFRAAYLAGRISALRGEPVSETVEKLAAAQPEQVAAGRSEGAL